MTVPFTDLDGLAAHLRDLAGTHAPIVLDATILAPALAGALAAGFALPDGQHLAVTGIATNDIVTSTHGFASVGAG